MKEKEKPPWYDSLFKGLPQKDHKVISFKPCSIEDAEEMIRNSVEKRDKKENQKWLEDEQKRQQ